MFIVQPHEFFFILEDGRIKGTYSFKHSSCQNENVSLTVYFYSYKVYIFEKENKFPF